MANTQRDPVREQYWREVLARQARSGLNVRSFVVASDWRRPLSMPGVGRLVRHNIGPRLLVVSRDTDVRAFSTLA